jgi:hypothetical protein
LFVPGFHYLSDKSSGADFANQRQFFHELGVRVDLLRTEEDGTVEENAAIIAANIRALHDADAILVSTSKAGPEVALALGKILAPDETARVKAWISVGGLIWGTPLADYATTWPQSWIVRLMFRYSRTGFQGIPGLTTAASQARMERIRIPARIMIVEYIAVPLSGDIYGSVESRYARLRKDGPNDGLTLLADELLPNGIAVIEPGIDHFYAASDIEVKSVALANVVAESVFFQPASKFTERGHLLGLPLRRGRRKKPSTLITFHLSLLSGIVLQLESEIGARTDSEKAQSGDIDKNRFLLSPTRRFESSTERYR